MSLILAAMAATAILFIAPFYVSVDGYKDKLSDAIEATIDVKPQLKGEVKISFFPSLSVTVQDVLIPRSNEESNSTIIRAESIKVSSSFTSLFSGNVNINKINLTHPVLELERKADGYKSWNSILSNIEKKSSSGDFELPKVISIENGTIAYKEQDQTTTIDYISGDIEIASSQGPFAIDGKFSSQDATINVEGYASKFKKGSDAEITFSSEDFSLSLEGAYIEDGSSRILGKTSGNISNLNSTILKTFENNSIFSQIKSNETLTIAGDFSLSNNEINFSNMNIASPNISGNIAINTSFGKKMTDNWSWDIDAQLNKIDIDGLTRDINQVTKKEEPSELDYYSSSLNSKDLSDFNFNISSAFTGRIKIKANDIIYNEAKTSNLVIIAEITDGKTSIESFSAKLPGNSTIELSGRVDHNGIRPLLQGNIKSSGRILEKY